jgi:hypothetical protein
MTATNNTIEIVRNAAASDLIAAATASANENHRADAQRRAAAAADRDAATAAVTRLVEADPATRTALQELAVRLPIEPGVLGPVGLIDRPYQEGTILRTPPFSDPWTEGEMLQHEEFADQGRLYLRGGAGAVQGASYGLHGGGIGWGFVFTSPIRAHVQVRPYFTYAYEGNLRRAGAASASYLRGGVRLTATGYVGWGSAGALSGGGSFHSENHKDVLYATSDSAGDVRDDGVVADTFLDFHVEPDHPTAVRIGSFLECFADQTHVAFVPVGDGSASAWLDVTVKWCWIESHPE